MNNITFLKQIFYTISFVKQDFSAIIIFLGQLEITIHMQLYKRSCTYKLLVGLIIHLSHITFTYIYILLC